jgi:serine/threonine protein phosphatase PrpC
MGVCDGHGVVGHLVSNFVKINLPKILSNMILGKKDVESSPPGKFVTKAKKNKSFLPQIGGRNTYGDVDDGLSDNEHPAGEPNVGV